MSVTFWAVEIRKMLEATGVGAYTLARLAGVSDTAVVYLANGTTEGPSWSILPKIVKGVCIVYTMSNKLEMAAAFRRRVAEQVIGVKL
jgi:predicted transcriptional regulator